MSVRRTRTRLGFDFGMAVEQAADFREHEAHVVGFGFGAQAEIRLEKNLVAAAEIFEIDGRDGAVGNRHAGCALRCGCGWSAGRCLRPCRCGRRSGRRRRRERLHRRGRRRRRKDSRSSVCAPKPMARPPMPRPASAVLMLKPRLPSTASTPHDEDDCLEDAFAQQHERSGAGVAMGQSAIAHAAQRPAHDAPDESR